jgi:hypothetical protein
VADASLEQEETALAKALSVGGFSEEEKTKILHFLGYPRWFALAPAIAFGYPAAIQPLYVTEDAFKRLSPDGRNQVRRDLCDLDEVECLIRSDNKRGGVTSTGGITFDARLGRTKLLAERRRLISILADDLGVFPNPNSQTFNGGMRVTNT